MSAPPSPGMFYQPPPDHPSPLRRSGRGRVLFLALCLAGFVAWRSGVLNSALPLAQNPTSWSAGTWYEVTGQPTPRLELHLGFRGVSGQLVVTHPAGGYHIGLPVVDPHEDGTSLLFTIGHHSPPGQFPPSWSQYLLVSTGPNTATLYRLRPLPFGTVPPGAVVFPDRPDQFHETVAQLVNHLPSPMMLPPPSPPRPTEGSPPPEPDRNRQSPARFAGVDAKAETP